MSRKITNQNTDNKAPNKSLSRSKAPQNKPLPLENVSKNSVPREKVSKNELRSLEKAPQNEPRSLEKVAKNKPHSLEKVANETLSRTKVSNKTPSRSEAPGKPLPSGKKNTLSLEKIKIASMAAEAPSGGKWLFEVKYDGYRTVAFTSPLRLLTRNGTDVTKRFASVASALETLHLDAVFDGEIAAIRGGKVDFGAISDGGSLVYFIFDLLWFGGEDLRPLPLERRKELLRSVLKDAKAPLCLVKTYDDGKALLGAVKELEMEGVVCKRRDASYFDDDWLKVKLRKRQEFVICGYLGEETVRSLLLGVYAEGELRYVGKVGSGIDGRIAEKLKAAFAPLGNNSPTLKEKVEGAHWLVPKLMAEVEFAEWTASGKIRQPSFKGLRDDKDARNVVAEKPNSFFGVTISHPDKPLFFDPIITKHDVAQYYESVAESMLPFLIGRPVSVLRCNDGIYKPFFVKHPIGKKDELIFIDSPDKLLAEVQLGTVEFHVTSAAGPTFFLVFDLDPDPSLGLDIVRKCVLDIKAVLDGLKLRSFLKTSGGKGFHIVSPMPPTEPSEFAALARSIASVAAQKSDVYTLNIKKAARVNKIFIDWQRNSPSATAVAPFSLRARKGAPVSMPIAWKKLSSSSPNGFDIFSIKGEIKDPWRDFFD